MVVTVPIFLPIQCRIDVTTFAMSGGEEYPAQRRNYLQQQAARVLSRLLPYFGY